MATEETSDIAVQVSINVDKINKAYKSALSSLSGWLYTSEQQRLAANGIKSLKPQIDEWSNIGIASAVALLPPPHGSWAAWISKGKVYLDGINSIREDGEKATLADIKTTTFDLPKNVQKDLENIAVKAGDIASKASSVAGGAAFSFIKPILPMLLVGVGVSVAVYVVSKKVLPG